MSLKKVKCSDCGTLHWPGSMYCEKCSGSLYKAKETFDSTVQIPRMTRSIN